MINENCTTTTTTTESSSSSSSSSNNNHNNNSVSSSCNNNNKKNQTTKQNDGNVCIKEEALESETPLESETNETTTTTTTTTMSSMSSSSSSSSSSLSMFDSFGILEHILSYVETKDLISATLVNRRWKEAGRNDDLWKAAIPRLWQDKVGNKSTNSSSHSSSFTLLIFWRSLFSKEALQRMTSDQIRSIFDHPLLMEKKDLLQNCCNHHHHQNYNNNNINNNLKQDHSKCYNKQELQRFLQVHMLDIMSDVSATASMNTTSTLAATTTSTATSTSSAVTNKNNNNNNNNNHGTFHDSTTTTSSSSNYSSTSHGANNNNTSNSSGGNGGGITGCRYRFFSDIYFGSYACSVADSKRTVITSLELCTPHGFDMYFKIAEEEVDEADRSFLTRYEDQASPAVNSTISNHTNTTTTSTATAQNNTNDTTSSSSSGDGILLYHHSTCYFEESRDFQIVLRENVHSYHPTDLKWRWLDVGTRIQVGPYPPLNIVRRRKDWGWNLENQHVVLLFRDEYRKEE